eukprot:COSAG02_NODE_2924_length_7735_cov_4.298324_8_plen_118_part_00
MIVHVRTTVVSILYAYDAKYCTGNTLVAELCVLRTFGGVDFSLISICAQYVSEFLWDILRASIQFPVMPKRAQYARFSGGEPGSTIHTGTVVLLVVVVDLVLLMDRYLRVVGSYYHS